MHFLCVGGVQSTLIFLTATMEPNAQYVLHKYMRSEGLNLELKAGGKAWCRRGIHVGPRAGVGVLRHLGLGTRTFQAVKRTRVHPGYSESSHLAECVVF